MNASRHRSPSRERGTALLVSVIMIFMLSMMGISAMRGASLEKRMTINAIQSSTTFQAAESVADVVAGNRANLQIATNDPDSTHDIAVPDIRDGIGMQVQATIRQTGTGLAPGYSIGSGSFQGFRYRVRGRAAIPNVDTDASVEQGIVQVAPADP